MLSFNMEELDSVRTEHCLGYHTKGTMSYEFDKAEKFTLVTSNEDEAYEVSYRRDASKNGFIWVIEGRKVKGKTQYYLQEVFRPTQRCTKAEKYHYSGAKKKFDYTLEGVGVDFKNSILLNDLPWFPEFKKRNGNFGFGLRLLRDDAVKIEFLRLAREFLVKAGGIG
jgi:hypothetical protein